MPAETAQGEEVSDPLERATSKAPPTLGEGCVRRYDPQALGDGDGTDFPGAAELWRALQDTPGEEPAQGSE